MMRQSAWLVGFLLPLLGGCLQDPRGCAVPVADASTCDGRDAPPGADVRSVAAWQVDGGLRVELAYAADIDPNTYYYGGRATVEWVDGAGAQRSGGWNWVLRPPLNGSREPASWEVGKHFVDCADACFYGDVQREVAQRRHPATVDGRHINITLAWVEETAPANIVHGFHDGIPGTGPLTITELEAYTGQLATADGAFVYTVADFHHWLHYVPACVLDEVPDDPGMTVWKHGRAIGACSPSDDGPG